jgi:hypothetical protein
VTGFSFPCADKFPRKNGKHHCCGHLQPGMCPKITPARTHPAGNLSAQQSTSDNVYPPLTNNPAFKFYFLLSPNCQSLFALCDNQGTCRAGKAKWHSAAVSSPVVAETVATQRHAPCLPQYDMAHMSRFGGTSRPSRKSFQRQFRHLCHIC